MYYKETVGNSLRVLIDVSEYACRNACAQLSLHLSSSLAMYISCRGDHEYVARKSNSSNLFKGISP